MSAAARVVAQKQQALLDKKKLLALQIRLGAEAIRQAGALQPKLMKTVTRQLAVVTRLRHDLARVAEYLDQSSEAAAVLSAKPRALLEMQAVSELEMVPGHTLLEADATLQNLPPVKPTGSRPKHAKRQRHEVGRKISPLNRLMPFGGRSLVETQSSLSETGEFFQAPRPFKVVPGVAESAYDSLRLVVQPDPTLPPAGAAGKLCITVIEGSEALAVNMQGSQIGLLPCDPAHRESQVFLYNKRAGRLHVAEHPNKMIRIADSGMIFLTKDVAAAAKLSFSVYKADAIITYDAASNAATGCLLHRPALGDAVAANGLTSAGAYAMCLKARAETATLTSECRALRQTARRQPAALLAAHHDLAALHPASLAAAMGWDDAAAQAALVAKLTAAQQQATDYLHAVRNGARARVQACDDTFRAWVARRKLAQKLLTAALLHLTDAVKKLKKARVDVSQGLPQLENDKKGKQWGGSLFRSCSLNLFLFFSRAIFS